MTGDYAMEQNLVRLTSIDLTSGKKTKRETPEYGFFIGGMGVGEEILFNMVDPWCSPFDPGNKIVISSGPASGIGVPGGGRTAAVTKSPITQGIASTNAGGAFAPNMRRAGHDHVVIEGRSTKPVYILLTDGRAEILDAGFLMGKGVWDVDDQLRSIHGNDISTMVIGQAGEKLVRFASIMIDKHRAMARCGFGAVMGSKNLKAIVAKGTGRVKVHDEEALVSLLTDFYGRVDRSESFKKFMRYGTMAGVDGKVRVGGYVYRHFQDLNIPASMHEAFKPEHITQDYRIGQTTCEGCFVHCQPRYRIKDGPYEGLEMEGTQFNSSLDFGSKLDIEDFAFCIKATAMCNDFGMDIDCIAEIAGWLMECSEKGLISPTDIDGMHYGFKDQANTLKLIEKIALREGIGDLLAEGIAMAAAHFPEPTRYYAAYLKGNALYEPLSSLIAYGLGAVTSTRGGSHVLGSPLCEGSVKHHELAKRKFYGSSTYNDPLAFEGKAEMVMHTEIVTRACSCLGICIFVSDWQELSLWDETDLADLLYAVSGVRMTGKELGDRMLGLLCLEKLFNYAHAGFTRADDYPPQRLMEESVPSGPAEGSRLDRARWDKLLDSYYEIHGWDKHSSLPAKETLIKLGLGKYADALEKGAKPPGHWFR